MKHRFLVIWLLALCAFLSVVPSCSDDAEAKELDAIAGVWDGRIGDRSSFEDGSSLFDVLASPSPLELKLQRDGKNVTGNLHIKDGPLAGHYAVQGTVSDSGIACKATGNNGNVSSISWNTGLPKLVEKATLIGKLKSMDMAGSCQVAYTASGAFSDFFRVTSFNYIDLTKSGTSTRTGAKDSDFMEDAMDGLFAFCGGNTVLFVIVVLAFFALAIYALVAWHRDDNLVPALIVITFAITSAFVGCFI